MVKRAAPCEAPGMIDQENFDARAHVAAMAPAIGLRLDAERQAKVVFQFNLMARIAGAALNKPVPEHVEPAPVFRP